MSGSLAHQIAEVEKGLDRPDCPRPPSSSTGSSSSSSSSGSSLAHQIEQVEKGMDDRPDRR